MSYGPCNRCAGRGYIPVTGHWNQTPTQFNTFACQQCGGTGQRDHVRQQSEAAGYSTGDAVPQGTDASLISAAIGAGFIVGIFWLINVISQMMGLSH